MSTLKPEEIEAIALQFDTDRRAGDLTFEFSEETFFAFAAALETELRKRWFAEPSAWLVADGKTFVNKPFSHEAQADMSIKERKDGARKLPLYAAPQEQEPT